MPRTLATSATWVGLKLLAANYGPKLNSAVGMMQPTPRWSQMQLDLEPDYMSG